MNPDNLSKLSEIAFQYGPFFFALLFVLGITRWAYHAFKETNAGANSTSKAFNTVRLVFLCSFFFGLVLVTVSVSWWLHSRPHIYVFRGEIVDLRDYEKLASASEHLYFRRETKDPIDEIPLRNEHFLIVQDTPFHNGDEFDFEFSKNNSTRNRFQIVYNSADFYPKFRIDWDDNLHTNVLHPEKRISNHATYFRWIVHAAQAQTSVYQGRDPRIQSAQQPHSPVAVLQDSSSDVGSKIVALDELDRMPASALTEPGPAGHEPILATLLDLTRYSDKEVSYKAAAIIKKVDLDEYLIRKFDSPQKRDQTDAEKVLLKLNEADSARVLQKLSPTKTAALRAKISQSGAYQAVPTASAQGDRYYVRATWDTNNTVVVNCLTNLFHRELLNSRSLDQERALMKRGQRLVYWYDKDWSINMAEKIRSCGGDATFVQAGIRK